MCQAHTRLAATMLLALGSLATAAGAVRAEAVVVAATAPGYTAGQQLGTDPITVPDGATLVFLLKTGQVVTVKGPYEGPPPAATGDAGNRFDRLPITPPVDADADPEAEVRYKERCEK